MALMEKYQSLVDLAKNAGADNLMVQDNGAVLNISGTAQKVLQNATLNNAGAVNWSGAGRVRCTSSAINNSGAFSTLTDGTSLDAVESGTAASGPSMRVNSAPWRHQQVGSAS